ncbi:MAG: RND family efflux transporter MFP subunit [Rhodospirillaceae bacterium]|nr:MAG: RND family efflux transporter MFP subunit [Rhodospirillaceae bacterium]
MPAGLTAEAHLPLRQRLLYAVPPSTLTLDETGRVGIKTVTESDLVTFHPVTIVDSGSDGMLWVVSLSLPPIARLITVGQEFVRIGQKVEAVPEAPLVDGTTVPSGPAVSGTAS